jgi:hypothetical protein
MRWVWIVAAALAGCGADAPPDSTAVPQAPPSVPASATEQATAKLTEGMTTAVVMNKTPSVVTVKFDLRARPEIGQPLAIALVFVPQIEGAALGATFVADTGLTVPGDQPPAQFAPVKAGAGYTYELKVIPDANGVHYVSAVVQLQVDAVARMQTYSVPVIVGPPPG